MGSRFSALQHYRRSFGDLRVRTHLFLTSHNPVSRYSTVLLLQAELSKINVGLRRWLSSPGEVPRRVPIAENYIFVKLHVESVAVMNQSAHSASNIIQ
jgi:hypothetical protein